MIEDLLKEQLKLQKKVDGIIVPELSPDLISPFLSIPGMIGYWPTSSTFGATLYDLSGQGRNLTRTGTAPLAYYNGLTPYTYAGGAGSWSRASEAALNISGTETTFTSSVRGLTVGGWFWSDAYIATNQAMATKYNATGNQRAYRLIFIRSGLGNLMSFIVSTDGVNEIGAQTAVAYTPATWLFVVGRLKPSTELGLYVSGAWTLQTVGVPASIFASTAAFRIFDDDGGVHPMSGRGSLIFLSANALSDAKISSLYQQTRGAFGV